MKRVSFNLVCLLIISPLLIIFPVGRAYADSDQKWSGFRPPNCRCHSKNPQMVKMHEPFGVKDCMVCHQRETMQMKDKGEEGKRRKMKEARKEKNEKPVCKGCHMVKDGHPDQLKKNGK